MNIDVNGFKMAYDDRGDGPPVILIHGFPLCREMWQSQVDFLVDEGYRVITPDLRGFGESEATARGYEMHQMADDIAALMETLQLKKAAVGGMSMGGYVLHCLLDRHPEKVSAALFIVTRSVADGAEARERRTELARMVDSGDNKAPAEAFKTILFSPETMETDKALVTKVYQWMISASPLALSGALKGMRDRKDYLSDLPRFNVPSLVIGGEQDICIPPDNAEATAGGLPDSRLVIIAGAGHMANMEKSNEFNGSLLEFLKYQAL